MYKRGDSATNVVMFIAAMIAVLIGSLWVIKHNYPFQRELGQIDHELMKLQVEFGAACNSPYYESRINPTVEYGLLSIRNDEICINSNLCSRFSHDYSQCTVLPGIFRCRPIVCDTGVSQDIDLKQITYLYISKNETFEITAQ